MNRIALSEYPPETVSTLLSQIPFFNDLSVHNRQQYDLLLQHSYILEAEPGEIVIRKGSIDKMFYFLLKGQLNVYPNNPEKEKPINQLSPGQVLGALGIINQQPRTATLAATKLKPAMLFATDFSIFGELEDFSQIKLETKLSFLRIVVNNSRWKLEVYKMNQPDHPLVEKLENVDKFEGEKSSVDELEFLAQQSLQLANLLNQWNASMREAIEEEPEEQPVAKKKSLLGLFRK